MEYLAMLLPISLVAFFVIAIYKLNNNYKARLDREKFDEFNSQSNNNVSDNNTKQDNIPNNNQFYTFKMLNDISNKLDRNHNLMIFLIFLIVISTALILYFMYKWTYLINPDNINKFVNNASNSLEDFLKSFQ